MIHWIRIEWLRLKALRVWLARSPKQRAAVRNSKPETWRKIDAFLDARRELDTRSSRRISRDSAQDGAGHGPSGDDPGRQGG